MLGEDDYDPNSGFSAKYNSRAAALLRDKISTEAAGGVWDRRASPALNHKPSSIGASSAALTHGSKVYQSSGGSVSAGGFMIDDDMEPTMVLDQLLYLVPIHKTGGLIKMIMISL